MHALANAMKQMAGAMDRQVGQLRIGIVESVDVTTATARVTMQPDGTLTGWLPVDSIWIGNGWGLVALPSPGQQVPVLSVEGDAEHGVIFGGLYSDQMQNPPAPVGEFWLVHQSGSYLKLLNDGSIASKGAWNHIGTITATGDITAGTVTLQTHTHPDPQGGDVGLPQG